MMHYSQLVIAARKTESEAVDVKEVRSRAASVEVTSTGNGDTLAALTKQVAYLMLKVENKKKFSEGKGNYKKELNKTQANNCQSNSN